jgi:hypothetical protein
MFAAGTSTFASRTAARPSGKPGCAVMFLVTEYIAELRM